MYVLLPPFLTHLHTQTHTLTLRDTHTHTQRHIQTFESVFVHNFLLFLSVLENNECLTSNHHHHHHIYLLGEHQQFILL